MIITSFIIIIKNFSFNILLYY